MVDVKGHMLPETYSGYLKAESIAGQRLSDIEVEVIRQSVLAFQTPAALLPWLAWDRSVDEYNDSWSEQVKRQVVAGSFAYHRIKGTPAALKRALAQLDFQTTVTEWFDYGGEPYYFRVEYEIAENSPLDEAAFRGILRLINQAKNARSKLDTLKVKVQVRGPAPYIAAWFPRKSRMMTLYPAPSAVSTALLDFSGGSNTQYLPMVL